MSDTHVPAQLRRLVRARAEERCEYCRMTGRLSFHVHQVDHVIAEKHGGETTDGNLALSCILCNQFKGSDLSSIDPESGETVPLFHPRRHQWGDHFAIRGLFIVPKSAIGRVTARLLRFNEPDRVKEREWLKAAGEW